MWWELRLIGLPRRKVDVASARLFESGAAGLQEDWLPGTAPAPRQPWDTGPTPPLPEKMVLRGWFQDPKRDQLLAQLSDLDAELQWAPVEEVDWEAAWRASFVPIQVTERLVIAPPWNAPENALVIEPGQGFGSGTHPTTRMALEAVDTLATNCKSTLDVGCGSGILAIAAARLGSRVVGIDVEPAAIADSVANARRNGVTGDFSTRPLQALSGQWDLVLGNLHGELIVSLADDLVRVTGGWLVLAGILDDREDLVRTAIGARLELAHRVTDGRWVGLRYRRST